MSKNTGERNKRALGTTYEEKAVAYLQDHGYFILEKNFRCRQGEIDIVARQDQTLVFVEVKYRRTKRLGFPEEAVTPAKIRTICRVADYYRMRHGVPEGFPCRFDVVAILGEEVRLYQNAFPYVR